LTDVDVPVAPDLGDVEREILAVMLATNAELLAEGLQDRGRDAAVLVSLGGAHSLRLLLDDVVRTLARQARDEGHSWAAIGQVLHVTRQAAFQRFGPDDEDAVVEVPAVAVPRAGERATLLLAQFFAGEWEEMRAGFDARLTVVCPAELLDSVRHQLHAELGRLTRKRQSSVKTHDGYTVVDMPLVFERGVRTGRVVFDGRVAGFFVLLPGKKP
jgi:hypothetical protein